MISFSCSRCGMKLKVKDEFAGRSSRCPTCKQALVVPASDKTVANVEAGEIDGTDSSLAKVGHDGGVSLEPVTAVRAGQRSVQELLSRRTKKDGRYLVEQEIARGGMGVVLRAVDCDIRREVAVKYLLDQADSGKKARFVEEAQITGQLEHPNIVPIHELGVDARKRLFFSMKMVKGRSLAQVLDDLRQNANSREGILARQAAERPGERLQRFGLRPFLRGRSPGLEAGQHHDRGLRRSLCHGLGAGEGAEGRRENP